jgi:hypothetical protein
MRNERVNMGFNSEVHPFFTKNNSGTLDDCKALCMSSPKCMSIDYETCTEKCEMFYVNSTTEALEHKREGNTMVHVDKSVLQVFLRYVRVYYLTTQTICVAMVTSLSVLMVTLQTTDVAAGKHLTMIRRCVVIVSSTCALKESTPLINAVVMWLTLMPT